MKQHVTIVAALHIGFGFLKLIAAAFLLITILGGGFLSGDADALAVTAIVGPALASFLVLLALPGIVGGFGLMKGKSWARFLVIILAVFDLVDFPVGTAIAVYTLWVLLNSDTAEFFENESQKFNRLATT